jgi:alkanesulfonate monooxygenase SsuD/methylene tetrahydromethanopterin reductase-like flavin-dependent oxidoreductase (luciferase family)
MVYVAESEEKAIAEGREHMMFYFKHLLKTSAHFYAPPGHLPIERLKKRLESATIQDTEVTWELLANLYRTALGTPQQVAEQIATWCEQAQSSKIILHLHVGDMPHWKAVKNLTLFAEEVMPLLRPAKPAARQAAE